jgi:hypothetical protein
LKEASHDMSSLFLFAILAKSSATFGFQFFVPRAGRVVAWMETKDGANTLASFYAHVSRAGWHLHEGMPE